MRQTCMLALVADNNFTNTWHLYVQAGVRHCIAPSKHDERCVQVAWVAWQRDIKQLFHERLSGLPAQVIWKQHAPPHFCGPTGTETGCAPRPKRAKYASCLDEVLTTCGVNLRHKCNATFKDPHELQGLTYQCICT